MLLLVTTLPGPAVAGGPFGLMPRGALLQAVIPSLDQQGYQGFPFEGTSTWFRAKGTGLPAALQGAPATPSRRTYARLPDHAPGVPPGLLCSAPSALCPTPAAASAAAPCSRLLKRWVSCRPRAEPEFPDALRCIFSTCLHVARPARGNAASLCFGHCCHVICAAAHPPARPPALMHQQRCALAE